MPSSGRRRSAALLLGFAFLGCALRPAPGKRRPQTRLCSATAPRVAASGYAKKLAKAKGIALADVTGSGPGGRVVARDVEAFAPPAPTPFSPTTVADPQKLQQWREQVDLAGDTKFGGFTEVDVKRALTTLAEALGVPSGGEAVYSPPGASIPMTGMQKAIAKNMEKTLEVPVFRISKEISTDAFDALYKDLKGDAVTVSAMLAKAVANALVVHPLINAAYGEDEAGRGTIEYNERINVAQAVALDGGLITPVLKDVDKRPLVELSETWKGLIAKARAGELAPDEYQSGTFCISNLGMMGIDKFAAILPPGTGAILAIGASKPTIVSIPTALTGMGVERQMTVTLTCDHRIINGADAALFLKTLQKEIEQPKGLAEDPDVFAARARYEAMLAK